jgi:hypothetical protein
METKMRDCLGLGGSQGRDPRYDDIRFTDSAVPEWFFGNEPVLRGIRTDGARCQICGNLLPLRKKLWCSDECARIGAKQADAGIKKNRYGI